MAVPLNGQDDLGVVVAKLGEDEANVRLAAYRALRMRDEPDVAELIGQQIATFPPHGQELAMLLLRSRQRSATNVCRRLSRSDEPYLRAAGASQLVRWKVEASKHLPVLVEALTVMPQSRRSAALGLTTNINHWSVLAALRSYLRPDAGAGFVMSVLRDLLRREGGTSGATSAAVSALIDSEDPQIKAVGLAYVVREDNRNGKALGELLRERPEDFWLVRDLFETDQKLGPAVVEAMKAALTAPRSRTDITRTAALLRRQSPGVAPPELKRLLSHEKEDFRVAALHALVAFPGGLENNDLQRLLHEGAVEGRLAAADALRRRDDTSGLPVVLELLKLGGEHKPKAAQVLSGFRSLEVLPVLLDLLDDGNLQVRQNAWTGLQTQMRALFPYRRFDFTKSGYSPHASSRKTGIDVLRSWWASVQ